MTHLLLVDAGNTRLKWAQVDAGRLAAVDACGYDDLARFTRALQTAHTARVACVAGPAVRTALAAAFARAAVPAQWLRSEAAACGVKNGYTVPDQLGVDRWLALLATRARGPQPALVVSLGTAATLDGLDAAGQHLGGMILPGWQALQDSVRATTAGVAAATARAVTTTPAKPASPALLARDTAQALADGARAAIVGAVVVELTRLTAYCADHGTAPRLNLTGGDTPRLMLTGGDAPRLVLTGGDAPRLLLTGGDAPRLLNALTDALPGVAIDHVPALVLEGLALPCLAAPAAAAAQ